mgnify:CR=1 FL=1
MKNGSMMKMIIIEQCSMMISYKKWRMVTIIVTLTMEQCSMMMVLLAMEDFCMMVT